MFYFRLGKEEVSLQEFRKQHVLVHARPTCLFAFDSMDVLVSGAQDVLGGDFFGGDGIAPDL